MFPRHDTRLLDQLKAPVGALETQFAASCATAANLLSALVADLAFRQPDHESAG
jgi:hypothetical protein